MGKKDINNDSINFCTTIIMGCLFKYNREKLSYDNDKIKNMIAVRDEKERVNVVAQFNMLTEEERAIELINKKLGLGKWSVGGTKLIYAYDKDYYDLEREKRLMAGIMEFPGSGNGEMNPPEGRQTDQFGFPVYTDFDFEGEGGYSHDQHEDDDNE